MQQTITINQNRLFEKIRRYFGTPESAVQEAVQNAYRSYLPIPAGGLPTIALEWDEEHHILVVADLGRGIRDPMAMLSLASSDWADDVEHDQDPAGMGCCGILAFCDRATWESQFGSITVESDRFFGDAAYRASLAGQINSVDPRPVGTRLTLEGFQDKTLSQYKLSNLLQWYRQVTVSLNGKALESGRSLPGFIGRLEEPLETTLYSDLKAEHSWSSDRSTQIHLLWHGHHIGTNWTPEPITHLIEGQDLSLTYTGCSGGLSLWIDVRDENVVTPRLPDRTQLILDDRTRAFLARCWGVAVRKYHTRLQERLASPPLDIKGWQNFQRALTGVEGFSAAVRQMCPYALVKRAELRQDSDEARHRAYAEVVPLAGLRRYCQDEVALLLGDQYSNPVGDVSHGMLFEEADPLAVQNLYRTYNDETHRIVIDCPDGAMPQGKPHVLKQATLWALPLDQAPTRHDPQEIRALLAANPEWQIEHDGWISLTGEYLDSDDITSLLVIGAGARDYREARELIEQAQESYARYQHEDSDEDYRELVSDQEGWWAHAEAQWEGKIKLPIRLLALSGALPGRPINFTVDVVAGTITYGGMTHKIAD